MKKIITLIFTVTNLLVQGQDVQFEDERFNNFLLNHAVVQGFNNGNYPTIKIDADSNGIISVAEAKAVSRLTCRGDVNGLNFNDKISGLGGIESFENLEFLDVSAQNLSHVNLDQNDKLKIFVSIPGDLVSATFTGLDSLQVIDIDDNRLSSILLKQLPDLRSVSVRNNNLIEVDASECDSVVDIQVKGNPIQDLCVPTNAYAAVTVDTAIVVDTLCGVNVPENNIVFRDSLFEKFLVKFGSFGAVVGNQGVEINIDPDGDGKISYDDAEKVHSIFCSGYQIGIDTTKDWFSDIAGIEAFPNLERLELFNQNLRNADVSQNKKLTLFTIMRTPLDSITVENLPLLEILSLGSNDLNTMNLSNLPKLKVLSVFDNNLQELDLSEFGSLERLGAENNSLTKICLPKSRFDSVQVTKDNGTVLDTLCGVNSIYFSDQNLQNAVLAYQPPIDTDSNGVITYNEAYEVDSINLSYQNIILFTGLEAFKNLKSINISNNQLAQLDVSQLVYLTSLIASNNLLKSLVTFAGEPTTRRSNIENDQLLEIDLSNNDFENLDISIFNSLNSFDGTGNSDLLEICVTSNQLENKVESWSKDDHTTWSNDNCARVTSIAAKSTSFQNPYPNPASHFVVVSKKVRQVFNLSGISQEVNLISSNLLDVSEYQQGVYYIHFVDGSVSKVLVLRW